LEFAPELAELARTREGRAPTAEREGWDRAAAHFRIEIEGLAMPTLRTIASILFERPRRARAG